MKSFTGELRLRRNLNEERKSNLDYKDKDREILSLWNMEEYGKLRMKTMPLYFLTYAIKLDQLLLENLLLLWGFF